MTGGRGVPGPRRGSRAVWVAVAAAGAVVAGAGAGPPRREGPPDSQAIPADDQTFRPTVLIRKGPAQGSGTVIASVGNETLILTAAHVVRGPGPLRVELHRYNLGRERAEDGEGWPLSVPAEVAATDPPADVAVVRIRGMGALPHVARIAPGDGEPARGTVVTSVGIDGGTHLSSWAAQVVGVVWFEQPGGGAERPFLLTTRAPEHGRSGGGLFLAGGELVGVCMGRTKMLREHRTGIFASTASIRQLLRDHDLDAAIVQAQIRRRTEDRLHARPAPRAPIHTTQARPPR
ncbi:MAG TPA: serine protease [Isosphaeraceae bacterium]|nr:serine protease [Isosphaeraceae bacterium]